MCSPTRRATTSVGPPAANGTMTVIGLLGYCASAGVLSKASAAIPPAARKPVRRIMLSLKVRIPIMDAQSRPDKRRFEAAPFSMLRIGAIEDIHFKNALQHRKTWRCG
jgi:hypothetical protein